MVYIIRGMQFGEVVRLLKVFLFLLLAVVPITSAQNEPTPYLYYYASTIDALVIERADGTDSRIIGHGLADDSGAGWSPSGEWYASVRNEQAHLIHVSGQNHWSLPRELGYGLRWSPTEDLLFITRGAPFNYSTGEHGATQFTLLDANTRAIIRQFEVYVEESSRLTGFYWSPDGQYIGFYYGNYDARLGDDRNYFVRVSRSGEVVEEELTPLPALDGSPAYGMVHWTPQGWIAHTNHEETQLILDHPASGERFMVDLPLEVTEYPNFTRTHSLIWSPHGDYALYYDARPYPRMGYMLWLLSIPDRSLTPIASHVRYAAYYNPTESLHGVFSAPYSIANSWSPDGSMVLFQRRARGRFSLLKVADGSITHLPPVELSDDLRFGVNVRWLPDSQTIHFQGEARDSQLQSYDLATSLMTVIEEIPTIEATVRSPDGRYLVDRGLETTSLDTWNNIAYPLPVHSATTNGRAVFRWHSDSNWLITADTRCASDCWYTPDLLGVVSADGAVWRELVNCDAGNLCGDWLPDQVDVAKLPPGSAQSVIPAPVAVDYNVEFAWGKPETSPYYMTCLVPGGYTILLRNSATDEIVFVLNNEHPCQEWLILSTEADFSPDGRLLLLFWNDATLWDIQENKPLLRLNCACFSGAFSEDGSQLFTRTSRAMLTWDVAELLRSIASIYA